MISPHPTRNECHPTGPRVPPDWPLQIYNLFEVLYLDPRPSLRFAPAKAASQTGRASDLAAPGTDWNDIIREKGPLR